MGGLSDLFGSVGEAFDTAAGDVFGTSHRARQRSHNTKALQRAVSNRDKASKLFKAISADKTISEITRRELLFGFSELASGTFSAKFRKDDIGRREFEGEELGLQAGIKDLDSLPGSINLDPNLATPESHLPEGFGSSDSLVKPRDGAATLKNLENLFTKAREGTDEKFTLRQQREEKSKLLKDKPGASQFLLSAPTKASLAPGPEAGTQLPTLTPSR